MKAQFAAKMENVGDEPLGTGMGRRGTRAERKEPVGKQHEPQPRLNLT